MSDIRISGDTSGESPEFLRKLLAALAAHHATALQVTSGERSLEHNRAVGGATHSNHLPDAQGYAHAMDGSALVNGSWVPLGQLLTDAPRFGLRSGATFDWGGHPDLPHVDDAYNQGAGYRPAAAPAASVSADPVGTLGSLYGPAGAAQGPTNGQKKAALAIGAQIGRPLDLLSLVQALQLARS